MITDSFDNKSEAKINPHLKENAPIVDACIVTFSYIIEKFVLENYKCKQIGQFKFATGITPIYQIEYKSKKFAFYKTYVGAPACVGSIEDTLSEIKSNKYIVFGGCGRLNKDIINNFEKHKADGCISVEMECAGIQAMCNFRNLEFYTFFTSGDLLDAPKWDQRHKEGEIIGTQHDAGHFDIALELANYVTDEDNM